MDLLFDEWKFNVRRNIDQYESEVPSSPATSSDNIKLLTQCCTKNQSSITHKVNSESLHPQWISKTCLVPARIKPELYACRIDLYSPWFRIFRSRLYSNYRKVFWKPPKKQNKKKNLCFILWAYFFLRSLLLR